MHLINSTPFSVTLCWCLRGVHLSPGPPFTRYKTYKTPYGNEALYVCLSLDLSSVAFNPLKGNYPQRLLEQQLEAGLAGFVSIKASSLE